MWGGPPVRLAMMLRQPPSETRAALGKVHCGTTRERTDIRRAIFKFPPGETQNSNAEQGCS